MIKPTCRRLPHYRVLADGLHGDETGFDILGQAFKAEQAQSCALQRLVIGDPAFMEWIVFYESTFAHRLADCFVQPASDLFGDSDRTRGPDIGGVQPAAHHRPLDLDQPHQAVDKVTARRSADLDDVLFALVVRREQVVITDGAGISIMPAGISSSNSVG